MTASTANPWARRWQRFSAASVRGFHRYAHWLVGISWQRFVALSVLLLVMSALLQNIPPFSWSAWKTRCGCSGSATAGLHIQSRPVQGQSGRV
uniref:hypothetical protein n=1 Tax=Deinococcus sp. TaxID=47478 RepID=UPI00286E48C8